MERAWHWRKCQGAVSDIFSDTLSVYVMPVTRIRCSGFSCPYNPWSTVPGGFSTANSRPHRETHRGCVILCHILSEDLFVGSDEKLLITDPDSLTQGIVILSEFTSCKNSSWSQRMKNWAAAALLTNLSWLLALSVWNAIS